MAQLYDLDVRTTNYRLKTIFTDSELEEDAVIQSFRITAAERKTYDTKHYNPRGHHRRPLPRSVPPGSSPRRGRFDSSCAPLLRVRGGAGVGRVGQ